MRNARRVILGMRAALFPLCYGMIAVGAAPMAALAQEQLVEKGASAAGGALGATAGTAAVGPIGGAVGGVVGGAVGGVGGKVVNAIIPGGSGKEKAADVRIRAQADALARRQGTAEPPRPTAPTRSVAPASAVGVVVEAPPKPVDPQPVLAVEPRPDPVPAPAGPLGQDAAAGPVSTGAETK